jgi:hypothetical protein
VVPSRFPFTVLGVAGSGVVYYAHLARPPIFPVIELGKDPAPGDTVRIVGFGQAPLGSTENPAEPWTAIGTVSEIGYAMDGTPVFRVASTDRPRPGSSGAPVLDSHGRLVGMWTWNQQASWAFGVAIASSALLSPCNHQSREEPAVRPLDQHEPPSREFPMGASVSACGVHQLCVWGRSRQSHSSRWRIRTEGC